MGKEKVHKYKYYTEVIGQFGPYIVKHCSKVDQSQYEKKLKEHYPYFRKLKSGKIIKRRRK
jgi:hypothetical protein